MNLKRLFYFCKVTTGGGVARASKGLHVTLQTISGEIQFLEREIAITQAARDRIFQAVAG